jgi:AcrR family transcriptional regulator
VRSAASLFARNGFDRSTLNEVSRAAGVTKGAFYFHFSSKNELGDAVISEAIAKLRSLVDRLLRSSLPALQALIDMTHVLTHWIEREPVIGASLRAARECDQHGHPFVTFHEELLDAVKMILLVARKEGEIYTDVAVDAVSRLVLMFCVGMETLWRTGIPRQAPRTGLADVWGLILPGIVDLEIMNRLDLNGSATLDSD